LKTQAVLIDKAPLLSRPAAPVVSAGRSELRQARHGIAHHQAAAKGGERQKTRVARMERKVRAQPDNKKRQPHHKLNAGPNLTQLHRLLPFPIKQKKMCRDRAHFLIRQVTV